MKKALSLFLALAMCLSLFACGEPSDLDQSEKKDKDRTSATKPSAEDDTLDENDSSGENDTNPPADDTEDDEFVPVSSIMYPTLFSEGIAWVSIEDSDSGRWKDVAIDTTGKILFEGKDIGSGYKKGISLSGDVIYDKSGAVIASPEISGYTELLSENCNGYVLAGKKEESFHGDKYYIGVLNNKGEWAHPLSTDHPIVKVFEGDVSNVEDLYIREYIGDSIIKFETRWDKEWYYNLATNELTEGYVHYETILDDVEDVGVYSYDTSGNYTLVLKDILGDVFFEDTFIGRPIEYRYGVEGGYRLYDYSGNIITDLSEYKIDCRNVSRVNDCLLVEATNENGAKYLCLVDKAGELALEPIKMGWWDEYYLVEERGFVYVSVDGVCSFYDYSGGVTELATDIKGGDGYSEGLVLVHNHNSLGLVIYYYVNLEGERVIG